jgi:hypothetical protein
VILRRWQKWVMEISCQNGTELTMNAVQILAKTASYNLKPDYALDIEMLLVFLPDFVNIQNRSESSAHQNINSISSRGNLHP